MKRARLLTVLLFVAIQAVMLFNVTLHDPTIEYDAEDHLSYFATLAQHRLPTLDDSREFYCPPLPYLVPTLALMSGATTEWGAGKIAQFVNLICSVVLCVFLCKICELMAPGADDLKFWSLAMLAITPVYFKTFAMVRGEPMLAMFATASIFYTLRAFREGERRRYDFVILGVMLGLTILSRQWALMIPPAIAVYAFALPRPTLKERILNLKPLVVSFAIAAMVGGWWYVSLYERFGSITPFNRPLQKFTLREEPLKFYIGLGLPEFFTDPIRPSFTNQLIPTYYSEYWGDWEGYFLVYGRMKDTGELRDGLKLWFSLRTDPKMISYTTNRFSISTGLGMVNLAAIVPSLLMFAGFIAGMAALVGRGRGKLDEGLLAVVIFASMAGYFWFMIKLPSVGSGNNIKATYELQTVPFLAILGAREIIMIREYRPMLYQVLLGLLSICALIIAPFLFTRYVVFP